MHPFTIHGVGSPIFTDASGSSLKEEEEEEGVVRVGVNVNTLEGVDMSGEEWRVKGGYLDGRRGFEGGVGGRPWEGGCW